MGLLSLYLQIAVYVLAFIQAGFTIGVWLRESSNQFHGGIVTYRYVRLQTAHNP